MRFKLTLEYDGAPFSGWQRVANGPSVQGALEQAAERLTGAYAEVIGAGRTDSGVHALAQIAHVDIGKPFSPDRLRDGLNAHLRPNPISVLLVEAAAPDFHARFDAVKRAYLYRIMNRRAPLALERGKAWRISPALDLNAMHEAAQRLVGKYDFTTFRDAHCQANSPVKTLDRCDVIPAGLKPAHNKGRRDAGGPEIQIVCEARSFLHRQVRSMVGTLVEVGLGKMNAGDVAAALAAKNRTQCGPVAPADGLYLARVEYGP